MENQNHTVSEKDKVIKYHITLEPGEEVFEVIPKHWGGMLWPMIGLGLLAILTILSTLSLSLFDAPLNIIGSYWFLVGLIYLAMFAYGLSEWYGYTRSVLIITNQRIIDCHQVNLLTRRIQTIDVYEIQSSSGNVNPGWGTILNFGKLCVNTIGDQSIFITSVPSPEVVCTQIMHYHNLVAHGGREEAHNPRAEQRQEDASSGPSPPGVTAEQRAELLLFRVPSQKLGDIMTQLPTQPQLTYHQNTNDFEFELIIQGEESEELTERLQYLGANHIVRRPVTVEE